MGNQEGSRSLKKWFATGWAWQRPYEERRKLGFRLMALGIAMILFALIPKPYTYATVVFQCAGLVFAFAGGAYVVFGWKPKGLTH